MAFQLGTNIAEGLLQFFGSGEIGIDLRGQLAPDVAVKLPVGDTASGRVHALVAPDHLLLGSVMRTHAFRAEGGGTNRSATSISSVLKKPRWTTNPTFLIASATPVQSG